ncbi:MAG TPA: hypothetical protein VM369_11375 [Candidatus Binatia bacterium]|nr:hypothetical protein [Candidatus Binatia bacterium]
MRKARLATLLAAALAAGCAARPVPDGLPEAAAPLDPASLAGDWQVLGATARLAPGDAAACRVAFAFRGERGLLETRRCRGAAADAAEGSDETLLWSVDGGAHRRWRTRGVWPFVHERRFVYASTDYRYLLLGGDAPGDAAILAREAEVPEWIYAGLVARLAASGCDVTALRRLAGTGR